jgi:hypothetical protein
MVYLEILSSLGRAARHREKNRHAKIAQFARHRSVKKDVPSRDLLGEVVVDRGIISTARRVRQHACVIAAQRPGSTLEHPNSRRGAPFVDSQCNQVHTQYLR